MTLACGQRAQRSRRQRIKAETQRRRDEQIKHFFSLNAVSFFSARLCCSVSPFKSVLSVISVSFPSPFPFAQNRNFAANCTCRADPESPVGKRVLLITPNDVLPTVAVRPG